MVHDYGFTRVRFSACLEGGGEGVPRVPSPHKDAGAACGTEAGKAKPRVMVKIPKAPQLAADPRTKHPDIRGFASSRFSHHVRSRKDRHKVVSSALISVGNL